MRRTVTMFLLFFSVVCPGGQHAVTTEQIDVLLRSFVYTGDYQDEKILENLKTLDRMGYEKFPALYDLYEENKLDEKYVNGIIAQFLNTDGDNIASKGDPVALNITRTFLKENIEKFSLSSLVYLAKKGAASDLELLYSVSKASNRYVRVWGEKMCSVLQTRLTGTNLIYGMYSGVNVNNISQTKPGFIPSVANTGPQAELVFQRVKTELAKVNGDVKKLPPELLTLTIPPPQPFVERFKEKSWLIGAGVLLLAGVGVLVFRKTRKP